MNKITKLPSYVYLYFFCQSINLMAAVISVAVAASVGSKISSNPLYATVPYGMQFLFLFLGTYPASMLMKKYGRKFGFVVGAFFLFLAGIIGYIAVVEQNFLLLILSHGFIGLFSACANYYRYAVTDGLPHSLQSKALSLVVAGGVLAGVLGPTLSSQLQDVAGFPAFSLCYASLTLLAVLNLVLIHFLPVSKKPSSKEVKDKDENVSTDTKAIVLVSICVVAFGYGLMNLLMIQSSLKMDYMQIPFKAAAVSIQWHVVAMFAPSFFTGVLISRLGHLSIISIGFVLFIISFLINLQMLTYFNVTLSLILLGLGWNFTYVGSSSLLAVSLANHPDRQKWQGIGDTAIAVFATIGAMSPSFLLSGVGWENSNIVAIIACIIPLLGLLFLKLNRSLVLK